MSNLDENMEWKKEFPHLAKLSKTNPYRVPENYFENLSTHIENLVFLEELKTKKTGSFVTPENYFEELNLHIEGRIAADNLKEMVHKDGFGVPSNYFNNLSEAIAAKTILESSKPKTIKLWQTNFFKYASAACLVLFTASGIYYNSYRSEQLKLAAAESATENMLYDIDESVIREHLQESSSNVSNAASDAEMESYILNNLSSNDITNNL